LGPYRSNAVRLPDQDHRAIKRVTRPMLGFKDFRCASILLGGIGLMHMIAKGQMRRSERRSTTSAAQQFYALAA
jgi:transposase-like protein